MTTPMMIIAKTTPPTIKPMLRLDEGGGGGGVFLSFDVGVLIGMGRQTYHWLAFYFRASSCSLASPREPGYGLRNPQTKAAEEYQSGWSLTPPGRQGHS
jgi:hypothetical protein